MITLFIIYMFNLDGKMVEKIYDWLLEYHDNKKVETKI